MLKKLFVILVLISDASFALAQDEHLWTLEECLNYAAENSIRIQKENLSVEKGEIALKEGKWAFSPSFAVSSSYTMSTGRVLDPTTYQFVETSYTGNNNTSISGNITIFEGGKKSFALQKAKLSLKSAHIRRSSTEHNLVLNIITAYLDVLCSEEQVRIAEQTSSLVEAQLAHSKNLLSAGSITESDVLQLQSQLFSAKNDISSANHAYELNKISLCDLLEIEDYHNFKVCFPNDVEELYGVLNIAEAIEKHPEYQSSVVAEDIAKTEVKIAKSALSPKLSLSAGYGSSYSDARKKVIQKSDGTMSYFSYPFWDQYKDNASAYASLTLSIPIFSAMTGKNGIKRAEIAAKEAEIATIEIKKQLRKELIQAQADCRAAEEQYLQAIEEVKYAEEAQQQINEKYNYGTTDFLSWNTALVELAKAKYLLSEKKYSFILKAEILKTY